jgi:cytochrome c551/c552
MKKLIRLALPVAALLGMFLASNGTVFATKEMAAKEKKGCVTCHDMKAGAPTKDKTNLNDVGKAYKKNGKL